MRNVIVIGPPRSASSFIARILQERLGVLLDEGPIKKDEDNPKGYYEDQRVVSITEAAIHRWRMGQNAEQKVDPIWAVGFAKFLVYRTMKFRDRMWGFKDPRIVGILPWVKQFFEEPPIWIVTDRYDDEKIIKSQNKVLGISRKDAIDGLRAYRNLIKKHLTDYHLIDTTVHVPEEETVALLRGIISG